jgi:putative membrane protein
MRVLGVDQALALEALVRARRSGSAPTMSATDPPTAAVEALWYRATPGELVRLGLIEHRFWIVLATLGGFGIDYLGELPTLDDARGLGFSWDWSGALRLDPGALLLLTVALLGFLLFVLGSSIAAAWVRFWDFRLFASDGRLITERGLFTRIRGSARPQRLEALILSESPLYRLFGRSALGAAVVGGLNVERGEPPLRWLAPILSPAAASALLRRVRPNFDPNDLVWTPLHGSAFRRVLRLNTGLVALASAGAGYLVGGWGLVLWALLPAGLWHARRYADFGAVGLSANHLVLRGGVLDASSTLIARDRIHAVELRQSPFDRRHGTATLVIDVIAPVPHPGRLHLPYLAFDQAQTLARALRSPRGSGHARPASDATTGAATAAAPALAREARTT